jgi:hypothetical protein
VITLRGLLCSRIRVDAMQAMLRAPGDLEDVVGLAVVALGERLADPGRPGVVPGRFDEDPPRVPRAGLGDVPVRV